MDRAQRIGLAALAFLLVTTVGWWLLALWPTNETAPEWLSRARYVCFNTGPDGMPDASGWLLLIGQPLGMLSVLMIVWGANIRAALGVMGRRGWGRAVLATCAAGLLVGVGAAASRVSDAEGAREVQLPGDFLPPDTYPRLDRAAPALSLIDQTGERFGLDDLRGRPALVTFAFGNCHTVCPVVVRQALDVRRTLAESAAAGEVSSEAVPNVVIVSLDPWRDTPARLTHLAEHWELDGSSRVLTGSVGEVEAVLTAWNVARQRDPSTGDITHPPLVYLLDASGQIAYASTGGTASMVELVKRM